MSTQEVKTDSTALVAVQTALTEFDKIDAGLAALETKFERAVFDCRTAAGMSSALAARREIRDPRYRCEQIRKGAKAPVLALGRNIDERAKYITERLLAIETPIDSQIKAEEERKEAIKQEAARVEAARLAAIDDAIAAINARATAAAGEPSEVVAKMVEDLAALQITAEVFAEHAARATIAKESTLLKLKDAHRRVLAQEEEARRIAAERAELERLRAEEAERERVRREEAAKREAEDRQRRKAIEAEERASRERIEAAERAAREAREAEDRRVRAEHEAREADAKRVRDAEEARLRAERERLEEEQRQARREQEERERAAREERERIEREERRKAAEIEDGRAHLQAFVARFGEVPEFVDIAAAIDKFLRPMKGQRRAA